MSEVDDALAELRAAAEEMRDCYNTTLLKDVSAKCMRGSRAIGHVMAIVVEKSRASRGVGQRLREMFEKPVDCPVCKGEGRL